MCVLKELIFLLVSNERYCSPAQRSVRCCSCQFTDTRPYSHVCVCIKVMYVFLHTYIYTHTHRHTIGSNAGIKGSPGLGLDKTASTAAVLASLHHPASIHQPGDSECGHPNPLEVDVIIEEKTTLSRPSPPYGPRPPVTSEVFNALVAAHTTVRAEPIWIEESESALELAPLVCESVIEHAALVCESALECALESATATVNPFAEVFGGDFTMDVHSSRLNPASRLDLPSSLEVSPPLEVSPHSNSGASKRRKLFSRLRLRKAIKSGRVGKRSSRKNGETWQRAMSTEYIGSDLLFRVPFGEKGVKPLSRADLTKEEREAFDSYLSYDAATRCYWACDREGQTVEVTLHNQLGLPALSRHGHQIVPWINKVTGKPNLKLKIVNVSDSLVTGSPRPGSPISGSAVSMSVRSTLNSRDLKERHVGHCKETRGDGKETKEDGKERGGDGHKTIEPKYMVLVTDDEKHFYEFNLCSEHLALVNWDRPYALRGHLRLSRKIAASSDPTDLGRRSRLKRRLLERRRRSARDAPTPALRYTPDQGFLKLKAKSVKTKLAESTSVKTEPGKGETRIPEVKAAKVKKATLKIDVENHRGSVQTIPVYPNAKIPRVFALDI